MVGAERVAAVERLNTYLSSNILNMFKLLEYSTDSIQPTAPTRRNATVLRYGTRCYFNVRSKADMSQLNLPHGNDN